MNTLIATMYKSALFPINLLIIDIQMQSGRYRSYQQQQQHIEQIEQLAKRMKITGQSINQQLQRQEGMIQVFSNEMEVTEGRLGDLQKNTWCEPSMCLFNVMLLYSCSYNFSSYPLIYTMNNKHLQKRLSNHEKQAYEGARDFYNNVIPTVISMIIITHAFQILNIEEGQNINILKQITNFALDFLALITYLLAKRFYRLCNIIETTPVLASVIVKNEQIVSQAECEDRLLPKIKPDKYSCQICKILCDYRTRHCRKCGVCIERYDHHCFWIGNCVGRHNHKQFYLFLFWETLSNIFLFLSFINTQLVGWQSWILFIGKLLAFGFILFTGYLLIYHSMLISSGITTWQHMRRTKISYLKYLPPGVNPFSLGIFKNWIQFFTEPTKASNDETIQDWSSMIVSFEEAKTLKSGCNIIENQYYSCC